MKITKLDEKITREPTGKKETTALIQNINLVWTKLKIPICALLCAFLFGIIGYRIFCPTASLNDIIFMTGITLSTVGYGDILNVQDNSLAMWFTLILLMVGMGTVLYSVSAISAFLIEGHLNNLLTINAIKKGVKRMKKHHIICGAGETGIHVIREMHLRGQSYIIIDADPDKFKPLREEFPGCKVIIGDATSDTVLQEANIKSAQTLITTLNDKDNLFLTLTARMINPTIQIISTATELNMDEKLTRAGADYIINPNFIGGLRIASQVLRPQVVSFLDRMLKVDGDHVRIEELSIPSDTNGVNRSLGELNIYEKTGVHIIAYSPNDHIRGYQYNPPASTTLHAGGTLIFIGTQSQKDQLEKLIKKA